MPTCVLPTCRSRDQHAEPEPGALLCWHCAEHLRATLRSIDRYLRTLTPERTSTSGTGGRRAPGYESRSPAADHIIAMLDPRTLVNGPGDDHDAVPNIAAELGNWARLVTEECPRARNRPLRTINDAIVTLLIENQWITAQLWVDEYAAALNDLHRAIRGVANDGPISPAGLCTWQACGGPVFLTERTVIGDKGQEERHGAARCATCGAIYDGLALVRFYLAQEAAT